MAAKGLPAFKSGTEKQKEWAQRIRREAWERIMVDDTVGASDYITATANLMSYRSAVWWIEHRTDKLDAHYFLRRGPFVPEKRGDSSSQQRFWNHIDRKE